MAECFAEAASFMQKLNRVHGGEEFVVVGLDLDYDEEDLRGQAELYVTLDFAWGEDLPPGEVE